GLWGIRACLADIGWPEQSEIELNMLLPVETQTREGRADEFLERVALSSCNHVVIRAFLLQHHPHCVHVFGRPTPVAQNLYVSEFELLIAAASYSASRSVYLLCHETLGSNRRFMIEQNSRAAFQPVSVAVVGDFPESGGLRNRIWAARPELRCLVGGLIGIAEALARPGVVQSYRLAGESNCLQQIQRGLRDAFKSLNWLLKRETDRTLAGEVVYLVGLNLHEHLQDAAEVGERN